jgi:2-(1,2-epoxy-1,2-dihydrophenyl)acetyl-CoA isomerase
VTATDPPGVRVERDGSILHLVLDRPQARNALDPASIDRLADAVVDAATDESIRVVALTATGEHFCAGIDLPAVNRPGRSRPRTGHVQRSLGTGAHRLVEALWTVQLPVVAAVRGHAAGLGSHLALTADFVVAGRSARFSEPFVRRGLTPDSGGTFLLPRLVGLARAKEMLLLGRPISADEAAAWGLVGRVVDDEQLEAETAQLVAELATSATVSIGLTKLLVHRSLELPFGQALAQEGLAEELAIRSRDFREGLAGFVEKRPPEFEGR